MKTSIRVNLADPIELREFPGIGPELLDFAPADDSAPEAPRA